MKSFATNVKSICWKKVLTVMLSVALTFSCVQLSLPSASALEADGLSSCETSKAAALSNLEDLIAQAQEVSLKGEDPELAADVEYALAQAKAMTLQATLDDINTAGLSLQVALDTLVIDLNYATIDDMQTMVKEGNLTYARLVQMYLTRIDLYNNHTIKINAIRALNENALSEAAKCDEAVKADPSKATGMFGIPVIIKDNINTQASDGMPTTAGSIALANNYTEEDAFLVKQIKNAGAIILGKTNLSEFANFITSGIELPDGTTVRMPSGYSTLGGQVLCPYKPGVINPSGSSSGSGAGGAAALAAITIGTETSGSILSPTRANSLVGLKPTVGLVSRSGVIPLSHSQDTAGPMGRNVSDVALFLSAMQGYDSADNEMYVGVDNDILVDQDYFNEKAEPDYTAYLDEDGLQGKRLGVYSIPNKETQPDVYEAFVKAIETLEAKGATIVYANNESGTAMSTLLPEAPSSRVLYYDFALDIQNYLDSLSNHNISLANSSITSLNDIIAFNKLYPERLKYGQTILEECAGYDISPESQDMQTAAEQRAADVEYSRKNGINYLLDTYDLDALISLNGGTTGIAAKAGYPSISLPTGYRTVENNNESINLQFTGDAFTEETLIAMAYSYEQATNARIAPGMAVKTELGELIDEATSLGITGEAYDAAVEAYGSNFTNQREADAAYAALFAVLSPDETPSDEPSSPDGTSSGEPTSDSPVNNPQTGERKSAIPIALCVVIGMAGLTLLVVRKRVYAH